MATADAASVDGDAPEASSEIPGSLVICEDESAVVLLFGLPVHLMWTVDDGM